MMGALAAIMAQLASRFTVPVDQQRENKCVSPVLFFKR
jgi:hypothetical protein